jgi:hypothetical protein
VEERRKKDKDKKRDEVNREQETGSSRENSRDGLVLFLQLNYWKMRVNHREN